MVNFIKSNNDNDDNDKPWIKRGVPDIEPIFTKKGVAMLIGGVIAVLAAAQAFHACEDAVERNLFDKNNEDVNSPSQTGERLKPDQNAQRLYL